jgi:YVTN family beta-propeller protein
MNRILSWLLLLLLTGATAQKPELLVGPAAGGVMVPTGQLLRPAGQSLEFAGRPVDLALSPDARALYVKDNRGLVAIDAAAWQLRQELPFPEGGGSMHGIAVARDGARVYATTAQNHMWEARVAADGALTWNRKITLPGPNGKGASHGCGIALRADNQIAYVCLSRNNRLGVVDLRTGRLRGEIRVGVAPFDVVLSGDGRTAWVSNWGGRHPKPGERTAPSSGTSTLVDERGVAASGTVSLVDLRSRREISQVKTGLHPSDLELSRDGRTLYVANANSDTISQIDTTSRRVTGTVTVRPGPTLPYGSGTNALTLSRSGRHLYAANGGNNALAVIALGSARQPKSALLGFLPTGWYPGAVVNDGSYGYVANVKGIGSRTWNPDQKGWSVHSYRGSVTRVPLPTGGLQPRTAQVREISRVLEMVEGQTRARSGRRPVPVPERTGEPSVFEHVVYVIKENRTYDQVFGDLPRGNRDPALCIFGREVSPNHHALAEEFVLLDNFYCNGVLSADGHSWATEGNVTDHLEKSFGGFTRSYTFGDDPLTYSSTGFLWDNALAHGRTFRSYGEMDYAEPEKTAGTPEERYRAYLAEPARHRFSQNIGVEKLRRYSCRKYPGWNMGIPDVLRADVFLREFKRYEQRGDWPNLVIVYLPSDHTSGTTPGMPTPSAHMADNDLALGRVVEAVSRSRFWPKTCLFVIEDDPQDGFDHVDGHRSLCLVVSPYTRRGALVSKFYNQTSVLHTMERILGLPPMNQMDAMAPTMEECFTPVPDLRPFTCRPNHVPLAEFNPPLQKLSGRRLHWAKQSLAQPLDRLDAADENIFNRILWHARRGADAPYPAHLAGAHGTGLRKLRLKLDARAEED